MSDLISEVCEILSDLYPMDGEKVIPIKELNKAYDKILDLRPTCNQLATDCISRRAALDAIRPLQTYKLFEGDDMVLIDKAEVQTELMTLSSPQPTIIRCKECIYYDAPHIENNGKRYEYCDMPKAAFDPLGTGLVNLDYGINVGGMCCRDYNKGYSEDKRVFRSENDFCSYGERGEE